MRAYLITIETPRRRTLQVVADRAEDAARAARRTIGATSKVVDVALVARNDQDAGRAAIRFILAQPYLPLDGEEATVADWLVAAKLGNESPTGPHNKALAPAGLRVSPDGDLIIASATAIPTLADWLADTAFNGRNLLPALARLPGTARTTLTFAGIAAKAMLLPWALAEEATR